MLQHYFLRLGGGPVSAQSRPSLGQYSPEINVAKKFAGPLVKAESATVAALIKPTNLPTFLLNYFLSVLPTFLLNIMGRTQGVFCVRDTVTL